MTDSLYSNHALANQPSDVLIVGAGPTGKLLALYLGRLGHRVTVVERHPSAYPLPRAVAFDDEIARVLADIGIDPDNDGAIEFVNEWYYLVNAENERIGAFDWTGRTDAGWHCHYFFNQPDLEARFETMLGAYPNVSVVRGMEAIGLEQDGDEVRLTCSDGRAEHQFRATYLVGADGANSFVRGAAGLPITDLGFHFDWLIVDIRPHAEMELESSVLQICDPKRPTTLMPAGPGRRRWEFMVLPGEAPEALNSEAAAWQLLEPWISPEEAILERHTVWRFQAKWAEEWRKERVLIAGDAAHLMPPFAGQGMCAGLRDAASLAWRMDMVLRGESALALLDSYVEERKAHVRYFVDFSIDIGKAVCVLDPEEAAARDGMMKAVVEDPSLAPPPVPHPSLGRGVWVEGDVGAGQLSRQGMARIAGRADRLDALAGQGWLLLGYEQDPAASLNPFQVAQLAKLGVRKIILAPPGAPCDAEDIEGFYEAWFDEWQVDAILIRPDRYVAAAGRDDQFRHSIDAVFKSMSLLPGGEINLAEAVA
ncbi:bifunctional 3-(3-hydroxy-phenyl)propionate/3-hydroxycinnamic acid hydroxylase [Sphingobium sp.]|uniref:bifunctional 3-(3-hydroxy-phenyl)propionate/3-hydroxycinnamic acid hydroxylase MhpA n=1 Tax=Sphingobium sp. TaxID=1912891 RepID=UPI0028BE53EF|nr:bifunctional 3-(3-hydroxy-phenyl)propionate/3-hydroxycinnamic acid hydroxylase [Sphingobium sp.]